MFSVRSSLFGLDKPDSIRIRLFRSDTICSCWELFNNGEWKRVPIRRKRWRSLGQRHKVVWGPFSPRSSASYLVISINHWHLSLGPHTAFGCGSGQSSVYLWWLWRWRSSGGLLFPRHQRYPFALVSGEVSSLLGISGARHRRQEARKNVDTNFRPDHSFRKLLTNKTQQLDPVIRFESFLPQPSVKFSFCD